MLVKRFRVAGISLLLAFAAVWISCSKNPADSTGGGTPGFGDAYVTDIQIGFERSIISNFFGKTDTLEVTAKAIDADGVGVERAHINFGIVSGPGTILRQDSLTNTEGDITALYVVTLTQNTSVQIKASVGTVEQMRTLQIQTKDITLSVTADPDTSRVSAGQEGTSTITVRVTDNQGAQIPGVPVKVERLSGEGTLTPVTETGMDGSASSTLTINEVTERHSVIVRAFVDVEGTTAKSGGGIASLVHKVKQRLTRDLQLGKGRTTSGGKGSSTRGVSASVTADTVEVVIMPLELDVDTMFVFVSPHRLVVAEDSSAQATITAVARDENGVGISGLTVDFRLRNLEEGPVGTIFNVQPTDATGQATASISTDRQYGNWVVEARLAGVSTVFTDTLKVERTPSSGGTLFLFSTPDSIYADGGITAAQITATLKDENQVAIPSDTVRFAAVGTGQIAAFGVTDSTGTARVQYYDTEEISDSALVIARYDRGTRHLVDSLYVRILPPRDVTTLNINMQRTNFQASLLDSAEVTVRATYANGDPAVPGTEIFFVIVSEGESEDLGIFDPPSAVTNANGVAKSIYRPLTNAGQSEVYAYVINTGGAQVETDHLTINISPTGAMIVDVTIDRLWMYTSDPLPAQVYAAVSDSFGNAVNAGVGVSFSAELGSITPNAQTDDNGIAPAQFIPGTSAGLAKIIARISPTSADSIYMQVVAGEPQSIEVGVSRQEIAVAGTGGIETSTAIATVKDPNDNPVPDGHQVFFRLREYPIDTREGALPVKLNESDGTEPGNPYGTPFDSAQTNNGEASVSISAGTMPGLLLMDVWTYVDSARTDSVLSIFRDLQIVSGPPDSIAVGVNEDQIVDGGGDVWIAEVSARVFDAQNNPVRDGIAVQFTLEPAVAHIEPGYVGNPDNDGVTTPGVAHTNMYFLSHEIGQVSDIIASVQLEGRVVSGHLPQYRFPLVDPQALLYCDPTNYFYPNAFDTAIFDVSILVLDGHSIPVNNQTILFRTTRGDYYTTPGPIGGIEENHAITGPADYNSVFEDADSTGWAQRYLRIPFSIAFPDPQEPTQTVLVEAWVIGYEEATPEPVSLFLIH